MNIIVIDKNGNIKNDLLQDINLLYKNCNYRNDNDFNLIYKWNYDIYIYELYGKTKGKKINKNMKYLPTYINDELYGKICILKKDLNNNITHFNIEEWDLWYNNICHENKTTLNKNDNHNENNNDNDNNNNSEKLCYEFYDSE